MNDYIIKRQRRLEFENVFGPFSIWEMSPFRKLQEFWDLIIKTICKICNYSIEKHNKFFNNVNKYLMKYIQGLFPV